MGLPVAANQYSFCVKMEKVSGVEEDFTAALGCGRELRIEIQQPFFNCPPAAEHRVRYFPFPQNLASAGKHGCETIVKCKGCSGVTRGSLLQQVFEFHEAESLLEKVELPLKKTRRGGIAGREGGFIRAGDIVHVENYPCAGGNPASHRRQVFECVLQARALMQKNCAQGRAQVRSASHFSICFVVAAGRIWRRVFGRKVIGSIVTSRKPAALATRSQFSIR